MDTLLDFINNWPFLKNGNSAYFIVQCTFFSALGGGAHAILMYNNFFLEKPNLIDATDLRIPLNNDFKKNFHSVYTYFHNVVKHISTHPPFIVGKILISAFLGFVVGINFIGLVPVMNTDALSKLWLLSIAIGFGATHALRLKEVLIKEILESKKLHYILTQEVLEKLKEESAEKKEENR